MNLKAKQDFSWAHGGVQIEQFKKGQTIITDDEDLIRVATEEGWVEKAKALNKADQKKALVDQISTLETELITAEGNAELEIEAALNEAKAQLAALG